MSDVSHWSEGLWWPGEAALCPPSPEVASDWSSVTAAGLWLAVIPLPHWSRSMVTPQYYQEFSCHSLSKHEAACFTNQIIIRPYKYLFSSSLPLSFSHKLTVYKLSCQNNFSDVQEIKSWEIYFQITVWVIAGLGGEAKPRPSVIRRELLNILITDHQRQETELVRKHENKREGESWSTRLAIDDDTLHTLHSCMRIWGTWMGQGS